MPSVLNVPQRKKKRRAQQRDFIKSYRTMGGHQPSPRSAEGRKDDRETRRSRSGREQKECYRHDGATEAATDCFIEAVR